MTGSMFPSRRARFLVRRRQADAAVVWIRLALTIAPSRFAMGTLHHGWFLLNDSLADMEALRG